MKLALALLGGATLFAAAPASAQTCLFNLTGAVTEPGAFAGTPLVAAFQSACSPTPDLVDAPNEYFLLRLPGVFNGPGIPGNNGQGTGPLLLADLGFYTTDGLGGFSANYPDDGSVNGGFGLFSLVGDQVFTGTLSAPTFIPGVYTFTDDFFYGDVQATLTITMAPVPEPATWAMMIAGFAAVGGALRRRRVSVRFA